MGELLERTILLVKDFQLEDLNASGQNFLVDDNVIRKEIECAELNKDDIVLDIGAGFGYEIAEIRKTCKVVGIEKDVKIFSYLLNKYELDPGVKLINGDALKLVFPKFNKIVSNPPYVIVDRILEKLRRYEFESGVMILPKTISDSLTGIQKSRQNKMSTILKLFFTFEEVSDVSKDSFYPAPRVTSKMVTIRRVPYNFFQAVIKREEMTVKNSILRAHQEFENKTKRESKEFFSNLTLNELTFKDKEIKKLSQEELDLLINFLKKNYTKSSS